MSIKTDAEIIRDETTTGANTAARVGANLVAIADELTIQKTAVSLNTGKVSYDDAASVATNTAKVGITTQQASDIAPPLVETAVPVGAVFTDTDTVYNDSDVLKDDDTLSPVTVSNKLMTQDDVAGLGGGDMLSSTYDPIINLNTAKVGITTQQASDITTNNSKVSYDDAAAVAENTAKKSAVTTANYTTLAAITTPTTGDVVQVTDNGIAGTFIYDATQSDTINYATIISGWVR